MPLEPHPRRFETTHWSVVIAAADARSTAGRQALATLCETYWSPVYAFICRSGRSPEDAKDLTQAFFAALLEKNYVRDANQDRGRFRSFLLTAVRHFLANEYDFAHAQKRGGQVVHVPLESEHEGQLYEHVAVDPETPERVYERQWAQTLVNSALARVALKFEGERRRNVFDRLRPFVTGDDPVSYGELARGLDMTEGAVRVAVHRLRRQWATTLRELVEETVENPGEVADELHYILSVLSR